MKETTEKISFNQMKVYPHIIIKELRGGVYVCICVFVCPCARTLWLATSRHVTLENSFMYWGGGQRIAATAKHPQLLRAAWINTLSEF